MLDVLRQFNKYHIDKDCTAVTGDHENELFFNCTFDSVAGLMLKNCDLNRSKFLTSDIRKALGFTLTLDCHSFNRVEYSELLFELLMFLMSTTKGNDEKRMALLKLLGDEKVALFTRVLKVLEQ